ncbi:MarR family winged helix-turn-helix transcriptional regulator [Microbacterium sp. RU33B]|uniref:MarR family winged helix-turn-helix transcriptional regulator n=1 Tax=Microbacterium sp. RU33B TaxID=1907390 RepID=UPI000960C142|nr:hypothetical protein [Microbacterium sp. RU33B]SIT86204.1 DNA-binding transcriptional regulator, MarR family [Microbacterium sp. RU33B]
MNTAHDQDIPSTPDEGVPTDRRPLGYWLRVVDALLTREFATAFENEEVSRREWMLLSIIAGDVERPGLAERFARKGKKLRSLEDRGWVAQTADGTWSLTDEGRAAKERLGGIVDGLRSRVAGAVPPEDFATTMASLEAIARELGWDDEARMPRHGFGRGGRRGFGPGLRPGFGPGHRFGPGFGPGREFGPGHGDGRGRVFPHDGDGHGRGRDCAPHGGHPHHGRGGARAEQAYERGFDAGFARGRSA